MSVKILHTGDWHLGKKLFKTTRIEEQTLFLQELENTIISDNISTLIISGDIFDTPHPPSEAIKVFKQFLFSVTSKTKCHILYIAGNHDSGKFLETDSPFFKEKNIHVIGELREKKLEDFFIDIEINNKTISYLLFPFFRSFDLITLGKNYFPELETLRDTDIQEYLLMVLRKVFETFEKPRAKNFKVLISHHLFAGYDPSDSEQGVSLSGLDHIPLSTLSDRFDYVALGHIHKKQVLSKENPLIIYPGSPIPFRFSENNKKWLSIVEVTDTNQMIQTFKELTNHRPLERINCEVQDLDTKLEKIIEKYQDRAGLSVLLEVVIQIEKPMTGIAEQIRETLKQSKIELISFSSTIIGKENKTQNISLTDHKLLTTEQLFKLFYTNKYKNECPDEIYKEFQIILDGYRQQNANTIKDGR